MITLSRLLCVSTTALALALPGLASAQEVDAATKEKLVAVIVKHGCKVTDSNNEAILTEAGLEPAEAKAAVDALFAEGKAATVGEDMVLKTEGCN